MSAVRTIRLLPPLSRRRFYATLLPSLSLFYFCNVCCHFICIDTTTLLPPCHTTSRAVVHRRFICLLSLISFFAADATPPPRRAIASIFADIEFELSPFFANIPRPRVMLFLLFFLRRRHFIFAAAMIFFSLMIFSFRRYYFADILHAPLIFAICAAACYATPMLVCCHYYRLFSLLCH